MKCKVKNCLDDATAKERCAYHARKALPGTAAAAKPYIDYDYINKLSPKDRAFLQSFTREYYLNQFNHVLPMQKKLHKTKKLKRELYTANDSRRRSVEITKCQQFTLPTSSTSSVTTADNHKALRTVSPEDALIEAYDTFNLKKPPKYKKSLAKLSQLHPKKSS